MSDPLALKTTDGISLVSIADPLGSPIIAPLVEISATQAVITTISEFEANAYLDLTLQLRGQPPRKFFAHVVGREESGVRIRWMHLDAGEEQKLKGLLAAYARTLPTGGGGTGGGHGTRRVIKPNRPQKTQTFMPFKEDDAVEVEMPAPAPPPRQPMLAEKTSTRRIIKPGAKAAPPAETPTTPTTPPTIDEAVADSTAPASAADGPRTVAPAGGPPPAESTPVNEPTPAGTPVEIETTPPASPILGAVPVDSPEGVAAKTGEGSSSASGRASTIGKDGRMDVGAAIRSKAKTVRASELAARHDKVRVLNMATIKLLIQEAVSEAAAHLTLAMGEAERRRLMEEAEDSFKERLKAFELDKKDAEEKARVLQKDLNAAKELLEQERKRSIAADQFTVSEAGLAEIDVRMMKVIERAASRGGVGPELELKLREMIAHILDSEREKLKEKELAAHNDKIALLEKKVARLALSLDSTEKERDEARQIAEAMERDGLTVEQVKNKYRIGLAGDDPNRERKLALMRELVEQNRELRKQLGIKMRDPAEVAREQAEEDQRKKEEAERLKRDLLSDRAEARAEAAEEPAAAQTVGGGEPGEPLDDPDDQPWDGASAPAKARAEVDDRGVKILRDFKKFEPPPLQVTGASEEAGAEEILVNPDDQPWQEPSGKATGR